jgi:mannose-6-phosphate isomerase-like protein (cupin superfamily)
MEWREVALLKKFSNEKFQKINLFESERMFCDIYCFNPGQEQKIHKHESSDKIYYVLEGRGSFKVGSEERVLQIGMSVLVPPGVEHGVKNTSPDPLVTLVFMTPKSQR